MEKDLLKQDSEKDFQSLNVNVRDEFYLHELESRLETDPLMLSGLIDAFANNQEGPTPLCWGYSTCSPTEQTSCGWY